MFQRILSALRGKKTNKSTTVSSQHSDATQSPSPESELVTVYDGYGLYHQPQTTKPALAGFVVSDEDVDQKS